MTALPVRSAQELDADALVSAIRFLTAAKLSSPADAARLAIADLDGIIRRQTQRADAATLARLTAPAPIRDADRRPGPPPGTPTPVEMVRMLTAFMRWRSLGEALECVAEAHGTAAETPLPR